MQAYESPTTGMVTGQVEPPSVTVDLTEYLELRIKCGERFVATTPEHLVECMAWLLTNVDVDTIVTKLGVEVEE